MTSDTVGALAIDGEGNRWLDCTTRFVDATDCTAHASVELAIQDYYTDIVGTLDADVQCWVADPDRDLVWTRQSSSPWGIKAYDGSTWTTYSHSQMGFPATHSWVASLGGLDPAGNLWVTVGAGGGDAGAVSHFDGSTWTAYGRHEGLIEPSREMGIDHGGRACFGGTSAFYDPSQTAQVGLAASAGSESNLTSVDWSTCVSFPPAAVAQDTVVTYAPKEPSTTDPLTDIGHFFDLSAVLSGTTTPVTSFSQDHTITVNYASENTEPVIDDTLWLYEWVGGQWQLEPTSGVDRSNHRVPATPDHKSLFAVLGDGWKWTYVPLAVKRY